MKRLMNKIGFTLIETLVVVGVIAILCGISVPGIIKAKHSMDVLEANATAKELFVAAQNRLTSMKADGQLKDVAEKIGNDKQVISNHYYQSTGDDALRQYLLSDNIFSNVSGDYIVELNPLSADILGVFYWAKDADLGEYLDSITEGDGINAALNKLTTADRKSLAEKELIGYYDSSDANGSSAISGLTSFNPEVKVINGNDLYLSVIQRDIDEIDDFELGNLYITLTFEDEHGRKNTIKLSSESEISQFKKDSDEDLELYFILDSVEDTVLGKLDYLKKPDAPTSNYLCEGDNMKVTVSLKYEDNDILLISTPASASFSSLFGTKTDIIIASTMTEVSIWNIRHLKNLAKIKTIGTNAYADRPISVTQSMDIDGNQTGWSNNTPDQLTTEMELSAISPNRTVVEGTVSTAVAPIILNTNVYSIKSTAGSSSFHTIKNISLTTGLFHEITCDLTGITIVNPVFTSSASDNLVGALAGSMSKGNISDCGVYFENQSQRGTIKGNYCVGGLIGQVIIDENTQSTITNCYANVNVNGSKQVGGLIGYTDKNIIITNCYSSGTVSGEEYIGGFIGLGSNTVISRCFTTSDVTGQRRTGGFIGYLRVDDSVEKVNTLLPGKYQIKRGEYYLKSVSETGRSGLISTQTESLRTTKDPNEAGTEFYYSKTSTAVSLFSIDQDYIYAYDPAKEETRPYFIAKSNDTATYSPSGRILDTKQFTFSNMAYDYTTAGIITKVFKGAFDAVFNPDNNLIAIVNDGNSYYIVNFHQDNVNLLNWPLKTLEAIEKILNPFDGVDIWNALKGLNPEDYSFLSIDDDGDISWISTSGATDSIKFSFDSLDGDEEGDDASYYMTNCYSYGKVNETSEANDSTVGGFTVNDYLNIFKNCFFLRDTGYNEVFPANPGMGIGSQTKAEWDAAATDALILNGTDATIKFQGWNAGLKYYWGNVPNPAA